MNRLLVMLPCLFFFSSSFGQSFFAVECKADSIKLEKILNKVFALPEVKAACKYVETASKGTRHLAGVVYDKPNVNRNYYWVKVWEDNGMSYVSHFNFFVDPKTLGIKYLDTINDTLLDLQAWRRRNKQLHKGIH